MMMMIIIIIIINSTEGKFWRQKERNSKYNSWQLKTKQSVETLENKTYAKKKKLTVNARNVYSIEKY